MEATGPRGPRARRNLARGCVRLSIETVPRSRGVQPPSEVESGSTGRPALERGGTLPEGATGPRARRSFTGAAPCPSGEAEFCPRVARPIV
jgi:hypothetical protein